MKQPRQAKHHRLIQIIMVVALFDILLYIGAFYMLTHQKDPTYTQVARPPNEKPRLTRMVALRNPIISKSVLLHWSAEAASAAYTYDQANYQQQLRSVINQYFTEKGGKSFEDALESSGVLQQLTTQQLLVTAVVQDEPALIKAGILLGRETWKVQLPLLVTYQTASQVQQYRFIVTLLIVRIPPEDDPRGIGIDQIWVRRA